MLPLQVGGVEKLRDAGLAGVHRSRESPTLQVLYLSRRDGRQVWDGPEAASTVTTSLVFAHIGVWTSSDQLSAGSSGLESISCDISKRAWDARSPSQELQQEEVEKPRMANAQTVHLPQATDRFGQILQRRHIATCPKSQLS